MTQGSPVIAGQVNTATDARGVPGEVGFET
jgi:hypothetical protein